MTIELCVSHHNEDLSWLKLQPYNYTVYSTQGIPINTFPNVAQEASKYLRHIVNRYDSLSDFTFFLHGHRRSYHMKTPIDIFLKTVKLKNGYRNINTTEILSWKDVVNKYPTFFRIHQYNVLRMPEIGKIIGKDYLMPELWKSRHCGQFYVTAELIKQYPKSVYQDLLDFCSTYPTDVDKYPFLIGKNKSDLFDKIEGPRLNAYVFEACWHAIFTNRLIDL